MSSIPIRYRPLGDKARGGFGEVLFFEDSHLKRKVAIKFLQNGEETRRLVDELRALLQMRSKHVVQVYDVIPADREVIGIVEECVEGDDLWDSDFPRRSAENYLRILWQIACGITDIHAAGVIHRDIKPNNMKLDAEGIVKIFDFGLARNEGAKAVTSGFVGTRGFAAPELFNHGTVRFTKSIDTYAFGASSVFLGLHRLPDMLTAIPPATPNLRDFSSFPFSVPDDLLSLIRCCLSSNPSERPEMETIRDEISRHLLRDKHRALAVNDGKALYLDATRRTIGLSLPTIGSVKIFYDGLRFEVQSVDGEVYINNRPVRKGVELPGSCVVAIGGAHRKANSRAFVPFDVSNPEVVI